MIFEKLFMWNFMMFGYKEIYLDFNWFHHKVAEIPYKREYLGWSTDQRNVLFYVGTVG